MYLTAYGDGTFQSSHWAASGLYIATDREGPTAGGGGLSACQPGAQPDPVLNYVCLYAFMLILVNIGYV